MKVHVIFHASDADEYGAGALANTVVQRGQAVFMTTVDAAVSVDIEDQDVLEAAAIDTVRKMVENNVARICSSDTDCS